MKVFKVKIKFQICLNFSGQVKIHFPCMEGKCQLIFDVNNIFPVGKNICSYPGRGTYSVLWNLPWLDAVWWFSHDTKVYKFSL